MNLCKNCGIEFPTKSNGRGGVTQTCSPKCRGELNSKTHYKEYQEDSNIAYGQRNMQNYKKFFLEEQNHECAICHIIDVWNELPIMFILDHIDGNADNNERINLRLVCPNCDSQLDTFKSKNKNSARAKYRK